MGFGQTALLFSIILSVLLRLAIPTGGVIFQNDALSTFVTADTTSTNQTNVHLSGTAFNTIPQNSQSTSIQSGVSFGFTDPLYLIFGIFKLLINVLGAPAMIFSVMGLPPEFTLLLGIPIAMIQFLGILGLMRGTFSW